MTEKIWAPWRIEYILAEKDEACIFCEKPKEKKDKKNYLLYRGKNSFVIMNLYPYISGHLMIAPYRHLAEIEALNKNELTELMLILKKSIEVLKDAMNPDGFNIGANLGKVAGAGIEEHLHLHIVPRFERDTNFMPVIADTRVIPEALTATYKKLYPLFQKVSLRGAESDEAI